MAQTPAQRKANERYRKSPKGKAAQKRYDQSPKGKAAKKRYNQSPKGKAANKRYAESPKGKAAAERAKLSKYGITQTMYALMYADQKGVCAICLKPEKEGRKLAVDHCHDTGKVRALLCMHCNTGLGHYEDDTDRMERAVDYIKVHRAKHNA